MASVASPSLEPVPVLPRTSPSPRAAKGAAPGPTWQLGFRSLEAETREPLELEVTGAVPAALRGSLYRIGPSRLDVYGERFGSWFDGDGMVHALTLDAGRVTYRNRFVDTPGKQAEDRARRRLYAGFHTRGPGGPLARFAHRGDRKNPANTNVVFHGGKLLALCEAGRPFRLDPDTLATVGEDDLGSALPAGATFSAHPKLDRATGEMWNFGVTYGRQASVTLYRTTAAGRTSIAARLDLPWMAMVHDFALTETRAVFVLAPIVLPRVPLGLVLGQRSFGESLRYRPELGLSIAVVDRRTGLVQWHTGEPLMMFHTASAWDEGDAVVVDLCAYPDASILTTIVDVMGGRTPAPARALLERLRISPSKGITRTRLSPTPLEFPRAAPVATGRPPALVYGVSWTEQSDFIAVPAVVDTATGATRLARLGPAEFAGECVPVAKPGATTEADVWLLTLVLDAAAGATELRILDGADLAAPPVATARLPHVVPFGFHGNWVRKD